MFLKCEIVNLLFFFLRKNNRDGVLDILKKLLYSVFFFMVASDTLEDDVVRLLCLQASLPDGCFPSTS